MVATINIALDSERNYKCKSKDCTPVTLLDATNSSSMNFEKDIQEVDTFYLLPFATPPLSRDFTLMDKELGRGRFGTVRPCVNHRNGLIYACKTICKRSLRTVQQIECVETELSIAINLARNPNVIQFVALYEDELDIHCVMELCTGGDLFDTMTRVHKFEEAHAADLFGKIANAVHFCHSNGIVHRDLKPENILLSVSEKEEGIFHPKLADFGLSVHLKEGERAHGLTGSPYYVSPEVIEGKEYDFSIDIWSLGVLLHALLAGFLPFWGKSIEEIFQKIRSSQINLNTPSWATVSEPAKRLVRKMLSKDPNLRPSASELLSDPWLTSYTKAFAHSSNQTKCSNLQPFSKPTAKPTAVVSKPVCSKPLSDVSKGIPSDSTKPSCLLTKTKKFKTKPTGMGSNRNKPLDASSNDDSILPLPPTPSPSSSPLKAPTMDALSCRNHKVVDSWCKISSDVVHLFA